MSEPESNPTDPADTQRASNGPPAAESEACEWGTCSAEPYWLEVAESVRSGPDAATDEAAD